VEASDLLREKLLDPYDWMSSGNADAVESRYTSSDLGVFVGTDESEFWVDSARHNAEVRRFFDGSMGVARWHAGEPFARVEGRLGWTFDRPVIDVGGETYRARVTFVWRQEDDGEWRIVHSHASVGALG
jgi:ketosteroid isomerase-like protein